VPAPFEEDAENLVAQFLGPTQANVADDPQRTALKIALRSPLFANPRLMKRCINRFCLVTYFESTMPSAHPIRPGVDAARAKRDRFLATWIAAAERWPMLRLLMTRHDDTFWEAIREAIMQPMQRSSSSGEQKKAMIRALPGPEAEALVQEQGALHWLRQEMFGEQGRVAHYREAEGRLRRWGA
jgi:hypothetical protein